MWVSVLDAVSAICCCCYSGCLVLFSTVKKWPVPVLPPCGATDLCKRDSMRICDLVKKLGGAHT